MELETGSFLSTEDILFRFNEQSAAKGGNTMKNIRTINDIVRNLFEGTKVVRRGPKGLRYVQGVRWRTEVSEEILSFSAKNLLAMIWLPGVPLNISICEERDDVLEILIPSRFKQDDEHLIKKILLQNNGEWRLEIEGQPQDLSAFEISSEYKFTTTDILGIINLVDRLVLCQGKVCTGVVKTRTCSVHLFSDDSSRQVKGVIKSTKCRIALPYTHTGGPVCLKCRKVTICSEEMILSTDPSNGSPTDIKT